MSEVISNDVDGCWNDEVMLEEYCGSVCCLGKEQERGKSFLFVVGGFTLWQLASSFKDVMSVSFPVGGCTYHVL
jgi:hypothetical protein